MQTREDGVLNESVVPISHNITAIRSEKQESALLPRIKKGDRGTAECISNSQKERESEKWERNFL